METYGKIRRRVRVALLASAVAVGGCSAPEPPGSTTAAAADQRRERLRDRLRGILGDGYDTPLPAGTVEEIRRGSRLYDTLCRACHGTTGKGDGSSAPMLAVQPPDLTDPSTAAFFSDRAKLRIIAEGVAETPMIGWSRMLEENEQIAVLHFMNGLVRESQLP